MEDTLWALKAAGVNVDNLVLILVLMEDTLWAVLEEAPVDIAES